MLANTPRSESAPGASPFHVAGLNVAEDAHATPKKASSIGVSADWAGK